MTSSSKWYPEYFSDTVVSEILYWLIYLELVFYGAFVHCLTYSTVDIHVDVELTHQGKTYYSRQITVSLHQLNSYTYIHLHIEIEPTDQEKTHCSGQICIAPRKSNTHMQIHINAHRYRFYWQISVNDNGRAVLLHEGLDICWFHMYQISCHPFLAMSRTLSIRFPSLGGKLLIGYTIL